MVTAGKMLQGIDGSLQPGHDWWMEVTNECATRLYALVVSVEKP